MTKKYQVVGIGNAIVDVVSHCNDDFLTDNDIIKGAMNLVDTARSSHLFSKMTDRLQVSGGSGANTIAGLAELGVKTAYVGKVKDDELGIFFANDIKKIGVDYSPLLIEKVSQKETGRCMIFITPDKERSMNTYLGVSEGLGPDDIDEEIMANTDWLYLEGYRFDGEESHAAFSKAIDACRSTKGKIALTLSDSFCVERHKESFKSLIEKSVDLLFCNEHEIAMLYPADTLDDSIKLAAAKTEILACTVGDQGAILIQEEKKYHIPAVVVDIVDATGAGDMFAAGVLYGMINGHDIELCGKMGCTIASEIICNIGSRSTSNLARLLAQSFDL